MTSISGSSYRNFCRTFLDSVRRRPQMYFATLEDLETCLQGHGFAFCQLGFVSDRSATFNDSFAAWLVATRHASAAAGWAVAIRELAATTDAEPAAYFFELLDEFFEKWSGSP